MQVVFPMISNQETLNLSPYIAIYDIFVPKDNMLRQINELVDFSLILEELKTKHSNGRNAIPSIRMFKYLLLKALHFMRLLINSVIHYTSKNRDLSSDFGFVYIKRERC